MTAQGVTIKKDRKERYFGLTGGPPGSRSPRLDAVTELMSLTISEFVNIRPIRLEAFAAVKERGRAEERWMDARAERMDARPESSCSFGFRDSPARLEVVRF